MQMKLQGITNVDFEVIGLYIHQILEKSGSTMVVHELFIDFKKAYDSVRRELLYNIFSEFIIPRKKMG
jgi:hypothetical protein